jgi:hypothetical protein
MLLIDDILLSPLYGVFWVARKIRDAGEQEIANQAESITTHLSELYMMLETGRISEKEFETEEKLLLDRLDGLEQSGQPAKTRSAAVGG